MTILASLARTGSLILAILCGYATWVGYQAGTMDWRMAACTAIFGVMAVALIALDDKG